MAQLSDIDQLSSVTDKPESPDPEKSLLLEMSKQIMNLLIETLDEETKNPPNDPKPEAASSSHPEEPIPDPPEAPKTNDDEEFFGIILETLLKSLEINPNQEAINSNPTEDSINLSNELVINDKLINNNEEEINRSLKRKRFDESDSFSEDSKQAKFEFEPIKKSCGPDLIPTTNHTNNSGNISLTNIEKSEENISFENAIQIGNQTNEKANISNTEKTPESSFEKLIQSINSQYDSFNFELNPMNNLPVMQYNQDLLLESSNEISSESLIKLEPIVYNDNNNNQTVDSTSRDFRCINEAFNIIHTDKIQNELSAWRLKQSVLEETQKSLIDLIKSKITDIEAYQRKTTLKLNYGKDVEEDFTENFIEAMNSETKRKELELSQKMLSKETVSFKPDFVKQSALRYPLERQVKFKYNKAPRTKELKKSLKDIASDKRLVCSPERTEMVLPRQMIDRMVMEKILSLFQKFLNLWESNRPLKLMVKNDRSWKNVEFRDNKLMLKAESELVYSTVTIGRRGKRFETFVYILMEIADLVIHDKNATKREIYYRLKDQFNYINMNQVSNCIMSLSHLLEHGPWNFRVQTASQGLVFGNLTIKFENNDEIQCLIEGGTKIPQNLDNITKVITNATLILIIEKDAIFQEFVNCQLGQKMGIDIILITGKGEPDLNTRRFVKKLWQVTCLPVFILVDCDPYGIEIMLTYRFGSLSHSHLSDHLAVPAVRWLGVFPSEMRTLNVRTLPMTQADRLKANHILGRPYADAVPRLRDELRVLIERDVKSSIEGAVKGNDFMQRQYVPMKLLKKEFL